MLKWFGQPLHLQEGIFEGKKISAYLYSLTIYNFTENKAGHYALQCNRPKGFITNWLNINVTEKDSDHILNITEYIHDENRQIRTSFRQELTPISGDNSKRSFKVPFEPILIGTGTFVALCLFVASARTLVRWHKGRNRTRDPDNTEVTSSPIEASPSLESNVHVDMPETSMHMNASHDFEVDYVELNTQNDSMIVRKPTTANKSKHAESSLMYVDLDIDHLQQACAGPIPGPRPTRGKEATVYDDIDFSNTKPHLVI
ncbi:uncharacterized protein LOC128204938 [Mya arenaria]|uniref:uncharacterized protein LOC128204938 n=1 Tax=Mya arenaria TaxID=6604 RepID=UPI0022E80A34|nr:uncharacterized protein LOC128204938 [Mya arenaria]